MNFMLFRTNVAAICGSSRSEDGRKMQDNSVMSLSAQFAAIPAYPIYPFHLSASLPSRIVELMTAGMVPLGDGRIARVHLPVAGAFLRGSMRVVIGKMPTNSCLGWSAHFSSLMSDVET
jgi:hypothetical protein